MHLVNFVAEADGGRFVAGEEGVIFGPVDEVALEVKELGGKEDIGAKLGEYDVELWTRSWSELGKTACKKD